MRHLPPGAPMEAGREERRVVPRARADEKLAAPAAKQKQEVTVESQAAAVGHGQHSMMMKQGAISESVEVNGATVA